MRTGLVGQVPAEDAANTVLLAAAASIAALAAKTVRRANRVVMVISLGAEKLREMKTCRRKKESPEIIRACASSNLAYFFQTAQDRS